MNTKHLRMMADSDDDQDVPRAIFSAADELDRRAAEIERLQAALRHALRQAESSYSETLLQLGGVSKERDQMKQQLAAFNSIMSDCASDCDGGNVAEDDPIPAGLWQLWRDSAHMALLHDAEVIRAFVSAVKQGDSKDVEQGYMWDVNDVADFAEEYIAENAAETEKEKVSHE